MTGKRGLVAAALLVLVFSACGKGSSATPPPATNGPINMTPVASHVKLLKAGSGPRQLLRLQLVKGSVFDTSITLHLSIGFSIAGNTLPSRSVPAFTMGMRTVVSDVTPTASTIDFTFTRVDVEQSGDPKVVSAMQEAGKKFIGVHARVVIDASGAVTSTGLESGGLTGTDAQQIAASFKEQSSTLSIAFPTQPVGPGARWSTTSPTDVQGLRGTETVTFVLQEISGSVVHLSIIDNEVVPRQGFALPGLPKGASVIASRSTISSGGIIETDLKQPMPSTLDEVGGGTVIMVLRQGTQQQRMLMRVTQGFKISSKKTS